MQVIGIVSFVRDDRFGFVVGPSHRSPPGDDLAVVAQPDPAARHVQAARRPDAWSPRRSVALSAIGIADHLLGTVWW